MICSGFRIFATSFLPLGENSLKYGSNDYGRTAHADDPELNKKMKKAAGLMNIKGHKVGTQLILSQLYILDSLLSIVLDREFELNYYWRIFS